ncbi:MAG: flagellar protein FliT [Bdellovibrionales bacterium]
MSYVKDLLVEKNVLLEKFHEINQNEIVLFSEDNFENLENFYHARDCILEMIKKVDSQIEDLNRGHITPEELSVEEKAIILQQMDRKQELVQLILAQDLQILSRIEQEKSKIIVELRQTNKNKKAIGSYKSDIKKDPRVNETA